MKEISKNDTALKTWAIILTLCLAYLFYSCANVTSPTGGPKDTIPPRLIKSIPEQEQLNYPGTQVMLEFDELMKLKNAKDEIIITPSVKEPKFVARKNLVIIDFNETLKDSTTYSITFRESLQDLNEGNIVEDYHLAFSTGYEIDSLQLAGNVTQLLKGVPSDKYTVAIYKSDTFNIFKHKPIYFTRTNKDGNYKLQNLKAGDYSIYAFEDKNKNLLLESKTEKFAFLPDKIPLHTHIDSIQLNTYSLDSRPIGIAGIRSLGYFTKIRLNKSLTNYRITSLDNEDRNLQHCFSTTQSEIDIFPNKAASDSTLIKLWVTDSLNQTLDSIFYVKKTNTKSLKEKLEINVTTAELNDEYHQFSAEITSSQLLKSYNADSIYILKDTVNKIQFTTKEIKYDTIHRKIKLSKTFLKKDSIKWKLAKLVLANSSFISILGDSSKRSSASIAYLKQDETATLSIDFTSIKPNLLIEILDEQYNSMGIYQPTKTLLIKGIKPSTIILRGFIDSNKNGKWDPGNPNLKITPETILFNQNKEVKLTTPLRANWEVTIKWKY